MKRKMTKLLETAGITIPPMGLYDVSDASLFQPIADPSHCIFGSFDNWSKGESTVINGENAASFGCPGAGYWLCGIESMPREDVAGYLAGQEGLKASVDIMCRWLENCPPYKMENRFVAISQIKDEAYDGLKTVTFFVNPDQLAFMITGAEYRNASPDRRPVIASYGSGCGQLVAMFPDVDAPMAVIGATDIAMRKYLPPEILAFTVNKPMFEQLCALDEHSFLGKTFWGEVLAARGKHQGG